MALLAQRTDEYHRDGCDFYGKLVVVHYIQQAEQDPRWGTFGASVTLDYLDEARALIKQRQYKVKRELLSIPDLVIEIE